MKLEHCREAEIDYSSRASDIARNLAFAAIAIVWVFRYESGGQTAVPQFLLWPTALVVLALTLDLAHYVFGAVYWGRFVKKKEAELGVDAATQDERFDEDKEFTHPLWYDKLVNGVFYAKILLIVLAYVLLLVYLGRALADEHPVRPAGPAGELGRYSVKVDRQASEGDAMEMESIHRAVICGALLLLSAIYCVANVWRSIKLKKGFSEQTIKMYIAFVVFPVLGVIAVAGVITDGAMAALLGGAAGYALGNKPWEGARDQ